MSITAALLHVCLSFLFIPSLGDLADIDLQRFASGILIGVILELYRGNIGVI